jgi:light-regulated signal transduction histidine kinase (bacteriophytochrome)
MGALIDAMLQLSRTSRCPLRRATVDLSRIARRIAEELQRREPERNVEIAIDASARAVGDPELLGAVLENLIGNAWKFTAKRHRARIEFGRAAQNGEAVYFVRDDGAGFDPAYSDKLFQPFQRLHATNDFDGTGIGLATVQRIVRRHGGRVWAEGAVEKGATFYFSLPIGPPPN